MKLRHLFLALTLAASGVVGTAAPSVVVADSSTPDPDHPFSDPVWLPLREPARISCATTNCPGPYHGYDALDLVGDLGDPIYAAGAGVFHIGGISPGCSTTAASRGTWVWIDHGPAGSTRYHHLDTITATDGQLVTPGTQIGTMGNSGDLVPCEVNYLHFEVRDSQNDVIKRPIPTLRACVGSSTVNLPQSLGFPTWDDVEAQAHYTPTSDNSCLPNSWSDTPDRPPSVSIDPGVGSMEIGIPSRPAGVDDVRVRLQLFHPSAGEYGTITEQPADTSQSTVVFDDLLENREYRAMVSFHNSAGWSAWSVPVADRTGFLPHTPAFRESDSSHTTIGYKWYRGTNSDADYTVAIRRASGTSWGSWSYTDVPSTDLHYRFRSLQPGTKYQVTVRARNEFGASDWASYHTISTLCSGPCPESARIITSMRPARFADSRDEPTIDGTHRNTGARAGGSVWEIAVAGRSGVPSNATAAVVNLTVLNGSAPGYATVYPCGARPNASSVNYVPGSIEPNEVIAKLSSTGSICVFTLTSADVIVDVVGYITDSPYQPLTPTRFADSRNEPTFDGQARARGPIASGSMWQIQIANRGSVPSSAEAAVVNVTVTGASEPGYATVYPCGTRPLASSLNYRAGVTRANELIAKLSSSGSICVYASSEVHVIVDVSGYLGDVVGFTPIAPARFADSRNEATVDGQARNTGLRPARSIWRIPVEGRAGVGAADAVVANVTVTGATGAGYVTVFDCGTRPTASTLNYVVGTTRPNETVSKLSSGGDLCLYTSAAAHLIVDVVGYTDD